MIPFRYLLIDEGGAISGTNCAELAEKLSINCGDQFIVIDMDKKVFVDDKVICNKTSIKLEHFEDYEDYENEGTDSPDNPDGPESEGFAPGFEERCSKL